MESIRDHLPKSIQSLLLRSDFRAKSALKWSSQIDLEMYSSHYGWISHARSMDDQ